MRRTILSALCLALLVGCSYVHAEDAEKPNLAKMRVKQLREILSDRGVNHAGIMEKGDLVKLAEESYDLPVVATPPKPVVDEKPDKPMSNEDLDDVLRKLQAETGQGFKVFRPGDDMDSFMGNMKNEYGEGGGKSKSKRKGKKATANKDDL